MDDVLAFHQDLLAAFGGQEGVRDLALLESAIAQPSQMFSGTFLHEDLAAMAAAYLYHIVKNHPFLDGNKRVGIHAALAFLELNGHSIDIDADQGEQFVLGIATGKITKEQASVFFRELLAS